MKTCPKTGERCINWCGEEPKRIVTVDSRPKLTRAELAVLDSVARLGGVEALSKWLEAWAAAERGRGWKHADVDQRCLLIGTLMVFPPDGSPGSLSLSDLSRSKRWPATDDGEERIVIAEADFAVRIITKRKRVPHP